MITLYWYDAVLVPGIAQGIFLAAMLFSIDKKNIRANRILAIIIAMAAVMLAGRMMWARYPSSLALQWSLLPDTTIFLFGPLIYFYIRRLLLSEQNQFSLFHFIPAIVHLAIAGYMFQFSKTKYDSLLYGGHLNYYFSITESIAIALNLGYWYLGFLTIQRYLRKQKNKLSFLQNTVNYLRYLHFAILTCLILWSLGFVNRIFFSGGLSFLNYELVWTTVPLFIYVIGYFALKQPEIFRLSIEVPTEKLQISRLKPNEIERLKKELAKAVDDKIFLKNNLTLSLLSKSIEASSNDVSWLLNEVYGKSFYDYINGLRIGEFLTKIDNGEHFKKTILALAMEVGFNSKSTFNKAFKLEKNINPSEYIRRNRSYLKEIEYKLSRTV